MLQLLHDIWGTILGFIWLLCGSLDLDRGILIPNSRYFFTKIPHPELLVTGKLCLRLLKKNANRTRRVLSELVSTLRSNLYRS